MDSRSTASSPVDNETYDLLQTLTSKLEALEAYQKYEQDTQGDAKAALQEMAQSDRQHAERLMGLLRDRLGDGNGGSTSSSGTSGMSSMGQGTASTGD
jgi:hypothetical protein